MEKKRIANNENSSPSSKCREKRRIVNIENHREDSSPSSKWQEPHDLREPLLVNVLDMLSPSIPDIFSFSAVCAYWRLLAIARRHSLSSPPLLLCHAISPRSQSSKCYLKTLTRYPRTHRTMLSDRAVMTVNHCAGYSHGHLILILTNRNALVADVFTGKETQSPELPGNISCFYSDGILTKPPSSSSCMLVLAAWNYEESCSEIYSSHFGSTYNDWSVLRIDINLAIHSLLVFDQEAYGLLSGGQVFLLKLGSPTLGHPMSYELLAGVELPKGAPSLYYGNEGQSLAECDGKLLLVRFIVVDREGENRGRARIDVYSLNFLEGRWEEVHNIGDWCLFIDGMGRCTFACPNPARWGGEGNSAYIAGPGRGEMTVVLLNGTGFDASIVPLFIWPSPIWVFPSTLLSK